MAVRAITGKRGYRHAKVKRLIFLGLDGLDPSLTERYMAEGKLPNLAACAARAASTACAPPSRRSRR